MSEKSRLPTDTVAVKDIKVVVVNSLMAALAEKCPDTATHSRRVAIQAVTIGCLMGLRNNELFLLERAALLHDIGKLTIERSYIQKPGKLTSEEWGEMKRHPEIGATILGPYPFFHREAQITLTHHERYDGRGYPGRKNSSDLSIHSCIIAVADTYDAMTAGRAYRTSATIEEVIMELTREKGKQFHPKVVETFLEVITSHGNGNKTECLLSGNGKWRPRHISQPVQRC